MRDWHNVGESRKQIDERTLVPRGSPLKASSIARMSSIVGTAVIPRIVLLGAHRWRRQAVVEFARAAGFDPVILLYQEEGIPAELSEILLPERVLRYQLRSPDASRELAETLSAVGSQWYVLGLDDYVCELAAELSKYSARELMRTSAAKEVLHKHMLRARWNRLCEKNPKLSRVPFRLLRYADASFNLQVSTEDDPDFQEQGSLIVKPDALDASIGVHGADCWRDAQGAIKRVTEELALLAVEAQRIGIEISPSILLEHRIMRSERLHAGAEFSAEFLSVHRPNDPSAKHLLIGITQKYIDPTTFVEVAHCFPSETFPKELLGTVRQATTDLLNQLGVHFCLSHWEYIVTRDERIALVEAQLRPAGDRIIDLIRRATDCDPYRALFEALMSGDDASPPDFTARRVAAIFFARPEKEISGKFSIVSTVDISDLLGKTVFLEKDIESASGWAQRSEWNSRYVDIMTEAPDFDSAKQKCKEVLADLRIYHSLQSGDGELVSLVLAL
jgi:hypothetical protein